jgi:hypothetical protein
MSSVAALAVFEKAPLRVSRSLTLGLAALSIACSFAASA